ncbi:MAG: hypothetical protein JKY54_03075 [Flavobacteriales bacterium]|nr:hypothetical protein [Flavobacteriales bacterium]
MKSKIETIITENFTVIGRHKYLKLKSYDFDEMTAEQMVQFRKVNKLSVDKAEKEILRYEEKNKLKEEDTEYQKEYLDKVRNPQESEKKIMTKDWLWRQFDNEFLKQNGVRYSREAVYLDNVKPLIYYFLGDFDNFRTCKNVSLISKPSFDKGLLIIGGYGNGKTSTMKAFEAVLKNSNVTFKGYSANELVSMYEACENPSDKKQFKKDTELGTRYIDDVLTERMASNYGKSNIIKDIIEERYNKNKRTYISINPKEGFSGSTEKAIEHLGEKYGARVYDRVFDMFNVIEFKGKSFRK